MKKKGFSLIHCIIIVIILAILTAIIVPVTVNSSNSAVASTSDEATVDLLNEALIADEEVNGAQSTLCGAWAVLEAAGYNPNAAPLYSENSFWYYKSANRVIMVTNYAISYPSEYVNTVIFSNLNGSPYVKLTTSETSEYAHDSSFAEGTCQVCGAANPN